MVHEQQFVNFSSERALYTGLMLKYKSRLGTCTISNGCLHISVHVSTRNATHTRADYTANMCRRTVHDTQRQIHSSEFSSIKKKHTHTPSPSGSAQLHQGSNPKHTLEPISVQYSSKYCIR